MATKTKRSIIEREWQAHGLDCAVIFVRQSHRCGYVRIPEGHPFHGIDNDEGLVDVHGGVTWAGELKHAEARLEGFWLGFDCAHLGDKVLGLDIGSDEHFWTEPEVAAETERMAAQIAEADEWAAATQPEPSQETKGERR